MSLLLTVSFVVLAVFGRMLIQWLNTGDIGLRFAKSDAPLLEKLPGVTFVMSFCIALGLVAAQYLGYLQPVLALPSGLLYLALVTGFVGIAIVIIAQIQMGTAWRIGVDQKEATTLITTGLYAKSRNPIYFGIKLYWIAMMVLFAHPALWACAVMCWVSVELIVRKIEEPYLQRMHGQAFSDYCKTARRYTPL